MKHGATKWLGWAVLLGLVLSGCSDGALDLKGRYEARGFSGDKIDPEEVDPTPDGRVENESGSQSLVVRSPVARELISSRSFVVEGDAEGFEAVFVNGTEVPVENGTFEHRVTVNEEGPQLVVVDVSALPPVKVPVRVDLKPPGIEVISPVRGAFLVAGRDNTVQVEGVVGDSVSGVETLLLDGQPVLVDRDGRFRTDWKPLPGVNILRFEAVDQVGHAREVSQAALYGNYAPWSSLAPDSISARVGADSFWVLESALNEAIGGEIFGGFEGAGSDEFEIRGVTYQRVELHLEPRDGFIETTVLIHDLEVSIATERRILFVPITITGDIRVNPAEVRGRLELSPDGQGGVSASFAGAEVHLHNFDLDLNGLAGIIDGLIEGLVEDLAQDLISEAINGAAVGSTGAITNVLSAGGVDGDLSIFVDALSVDAGGLSFSSSTALTFPAGTQVHEAPGFFLTEGPVPTGDVGELPVRFSLSDDFLNQILANFWRQGSLDLDVADLLGGDAPVDLVASSFSLIAGSEILGFGEADTPVGIKLRPLLPPLVEMQENGVVLVSIADLMMDFTLDAPGEEPLLWASLASHLFLTISPALDEAGELQLDVEADVVVDLVEEPLFDVNENTLEPVIEGLLKDLPSQLEEGGLEGLLGGEPGSEPLNVGGLEIRSDGLQGDFLSIYLRLLEP